MVCLHRQLELSWYIIGCTMADSLQTFPLSVSSDQIGNTLFKSYVRFVRFFWDILLKPSIDQATNGFTSLLKEVKHNEAKTIKRCRVKVMPARQAAKRASLCCQYFLTTDGARSAPSITFFLSPN